MADTSLIPLLRDLAEAMIQQDTYHRVPVVTRTRWSDDENENQYLAEQTSP
jgi:hypothetical protein